MANVRVAINGFGRIGRLAFRQMFGAEGYEIVAINDLTSPKMLAHLLKYDTAQGSYLAAGHTVDYKDAVVNENGKVTAPGAIIVDGKEIKIYAEKDAANCPWGEYDVDVVLECTGFYTSAEKSQAHLDAGAKRVLITDVSDLRLDIARQCGIADTVNVTKTPLKEAVKEVFGDEGFQVGFEVAGVESSIRSLMECIEKGSTIVIVAVFAKDPALSMFYLGEHELNIVGTMMYRHEDYLATVEAVADGTINLEPLISNRFSFEEYDQAYKFIDENRMTCMKVIVDLEK